MKKLFAAVIALMLITVSATMAERIPFTEWLEQQTAVAEQPVTQDEPPVAEGTPLAEDTEAEATEEATEEALPEFAPIGMGSRGIYVERLQEKLNQLGIPAGKVDGRFGPMTEAALKTVQNALGWEKTGVVETVDELNEIMGIEPGDGVNLAVGTSDEWSEWMAPEYNTENRCFTVSTAYLGDKHVGDPYTCQVEIEFANVSKTTDIGDDKSFGFCTQGIVDGEWKDWGARNVWNRSLIEINEAPADGIYKYYTTQRIQELGVESRQCEIGFRCDYWASGQFRVRCIKVEKGIAATPWSHANVDIGDGINLAQNTSSEWSEWMTPEYNAENRCFTVSTAYLGDKRVGEPYTCQVEIEFSGVTATQGIENNGFLFLAQGRVDETWGELGASNVWNSLAKLNEAPADGVYKYTITKKIRDINVNATSFELGFRCDYWASGQFRVRCVKVEKGMNATEWTSTP